MLPSLLVAAQPTHSNEAQMADQLTQMSCRVEVTFPDAKLTVHSVRVVGTLNPETMRAEPPPEELFLVLGKLAGLRSLDLQLLSGVQGRVYLRELGRLSTLRELQLAGKDVNDAVMPYIGALTNLETLSLWSASVGDKGLAELRKLQRLKRLQLSDYMEIGEDGGKAIGRLKSLEYLKLNAQHRKGALFALKNLLRLECAAIGGSGVNLTLAELSAVKSIQRIEISDAHVDTQTGAQLCKMENLRSLKLECCTLKKDVVPTLLSLPLSELECVGLPTDILSELARGRVGRTGDLHVW
jgi:hypothetical protein